MISDKMPAYTIGVFFLVSIAGLTLSVFFEYTTLVQFFYVASILGAILSYLYCFFSSALLAIANFPTYWKRGCPELMIVIFSFWGIFKSDLSFEFIVAVVPCSILSYVIARHMKSVIVRFLPILLLSMFLVVSSSLYNDRFFLSISCITFSALMFGALYQNAVITNTAKRPQDATDSALR